MGVTNRLVFNVTDAETIAASSSVGSFVRAGDDGTLIGHVDDALKVSLTNTSITVTASDLDIRALTADDVVTVQLQDGDGTPLTSTDGTLDVNITNEITTTEASNTAIKSTQKTVSTTGALLASQLAARDRLFVQNLGNKHVYVGESGITAGVGLQLSPGMIFEFTMGPSLSLHAVSEAGTQDIRLMEMS
jgi:hypothetical protein